MATPSRVAGTTASATTASRRKRRADPWHIASYVVIALFLVWVLVPILTVAVNSLKPPSAIFTAKPRLTFHATLKNYHKVLGDLDFMKYLVNSSIVAVGSTLLSLLVGVPAAYALARLPIPGREWWARGVLFTRMVPAVALIVPMFVVFDKLSLLGTYWALIAAHTTFCLPIVIWLMRSFFEDLPRELEESALVDGTGTFGAFVRVSLPLTAPGLGAAAILCLIFSWNEFLFALVLSGIHTETVPIGVASFVGSVSIDWGGSSAAAVLAMLPIFVLGLIAQRFLVRGLTLGAVKG
ncbi:MAG: multiple sugar transport system permease protein [Actinomycetota bacterium]|jgi:multiple sugar transport system permease protein|nr:multiple sugar transport system permease protein [Actinomycetota bacterium]